MDPDATLRDLLEAVQRDDWEMAAEYAEYLSAWLTRGGLVPLRAKTEYRATLDALLYVLLNLPDIENETIKGA